MDKVVSHATTSATPSTPSPLRLLIVDDSLIIRRAIARAFERDPQFKIVALSSNGRDAVDALKAEPADVVILDIEMPIMDGITAIPLLKAVDPHVQILMASTLTQRNADISIKALANGATDYIPKPSTAEETGLAGFNRELIEKVKALGAIARRRGVRNNAAAPGSQPQPAAPKKKVELRKGTVARPDVIAIGTSTGGPQALFNVIKKMGPDLRQPVLITQHMPACFTPILADHITKQCQVHCKEAAEGDALQPQHYYVAPGDFHMTVQREGGKSIVKLLKDPPENFCRPSVDPMLRSITSAYGNRVLTIMLTGLGHDGLSGSEFVVKSGGAVIAQDEATSVVWGMPGAVALAGLCTAVLPLDEIGPMVRQIAQKPGP